MLTNRKRVFFAFPLVRAENAGGSLAHLIFYYILDAVQKYGNAYEKQVEKKATQQINLCTNKVIIM